MADGGAGDTGTLTSRFPLSVFGWWLLMLVAALAAGLLISPAKPNDHFVSAAAVLAFVTTVAVGLERLIEGFFAILGQSTKFGGWWPLKQVTAAIGDFETHTNKFLKEPLAQVIAHLRQVKDTAVQAKAISEEEADAVDAAVHGYEQARVALQAQMANLTNLAPGSPRFEKANEIASAAAKTVDQVKNTARAANLQLNRAVLDVADTVATDANKAADIVASFADNPARKVLSLMIGSIMGILAASIIGLNLFLAALGADAKTSHLAGRIGVVLTGFVMGLGANPTHEVITALQRSSNSSPATGDGAPAAPASGGTVAQAEMLTFTGPLNLSESAPRAGVPIYRRLVRGTD